jgi:hypothetical protein
MVVAYVCVTFFLINWAYPSLCKVCMGVNAMESNVVEYDGKAFNDIKASSVVSDCIVMEVMQGFPEFKGAAI